MNRTSENTSLHIQLLGRCEILINNCKVLEKHWQGRHAKQVVKILALSQQHQLHREQLMEQLWPDSSPQQSVNRLNKAIYWARRALEPQLQSGSSSQFLQRAGDSIQLGAAVDMCIDVVQFESAANQALAERDAEKLRLATLLYTGDLLIEDPFDELFEARREQLAQLHQRLLQTRIDLADAAGNSSLKTELLLQLLHCDSINENYHRLLIEHYLECGERSKALAQLQRCQTILEQELGESPQNETLALLKDVPQTSSSNPPITDLEGRFSVSTIEPNSVAVLPFENTGAGADLDYLCEGISDEVIIRLAKAPELSVLARSTVFRFRQQRSDPIMLGQKLSVSTVVLGQLERREERLRVWVELVNTENGAIRWAQQYDLAVSEILQLRRNLVADLADQLLSSLSKVERSKTAQSDTTNEEAYHEYLKGRYNWNKRSASALQRALLHFSTAIDRDPVYALAYTGLADTYNVMSLYTAQSPIGTMPKARAAALKALAIDPQSCEAQASLGYYTLSYEWDVRSAEAYFKSAIKQDPHYPIARQWYHKLLICEGRQEEADLQINLAYQRDPLSVMISTEKAWGLYYSRQYPQAIKHLEALLLSDPDFPMAHYLLGLCCTQENDHARAESELHKALLHANVEDPFPLATGTLGLICARAGNKPRTMKLLAELLSLTVESGATEFSIALIHVALGRSSDAFDYLHRACDQRFDRLIFLDQEPLLDPLRGKPEFDELRARVFEHPVAANS